MTTASAGTGSSAPVVLVLEDDPAIRRLTTSILEDEGFAVVGVEDGAAGLAALDEVDPVVVVLDLQMPVMDGRAFFREMRGRGQRIPVLVVSAYGSSKARIELGAEDSLEKPYDVDVLAERVRALAALDKAPTTPS